MTRTFFLLPLFLLTTTSCNNKKSTAEKNTITTGKDSLNQTEVGEKSNMTDDNEKKKETLSAMSPLTSEQLEKVVPPELLGASRTELTTNTNLGTAMVMATYQLENNADLRLTILDCGGAGGAGIYGTLYADLLNQDRKDDEEYTKTIDLNGGKAIEHGYTGNSDYSITWFSGNRYLVSLEGKDKVIIIQAAKGINLN